MLLAYKSTTIMHWNTAAKSELKYLYDAIDFTYLINEEKKTKI
jgi:hypothetical protein